MDSKTEYITVRANDALALDREVNRLLQEGYALYGNPYYTENGSDGFLHQALTIERKTREKAGAS